MITDKAPRTIPTLDIHEPEGNMYIVRGRMIAYARQLSYTPEQIEKLEKEIRGVPYLQLLAKFEAHLGEYVTLIMDDWDKEEVRKYLPAEKILAQEYVTERDAKDNFLSWLENA